MGMKVVVFDVEHGACAFVRTPTNYTMLIDCGCTENFLPVLYIRENELENATAWNGHKLTLLTITHPHDDHIQDIETVTKVCEPAFLLRQKYDWEDVKTAEDGDYDNLDTYTEWQEKYNAPAVLTPEYGLKIESFWLTPQEAKQVDENKYINNSSIVTVLTVQGSKHTEKFLFGGDVETAGWEALLKLKPGFKGAVQNVDFFIVPHHGHASGFSEALYAAMGGKPIANIISIHHNDEHIDTRYSQEAYALGTNVTGELRRSFTTRRDGTITINVSDEGKYSITIQQLAAVAKRGW